MSSDQEQPVDGEQEQPAGWVREAVQRRQTVRDQLRRRLFQPQTEPDGDDDEGEGDTT